MKRGFLIGGKAKKIDAVQKASVVLEPEAKNPYTEQDKSQAPKFTYDASTGWTLKYSQHLFQHLVVPASNNQTDGATDCLLLGLKDSQLIPKYPSLIRKAPSRTYEIRDATDSKMGLGMFAARDLQVGELIECERPILLTPHLLDSPLVTGRPTFIPPLKLAANREAWESIFFPFFERIDKDKQDKYRALANSHPEEGFGPLLGTYRTNSFQHSLDDQGEAGNEYTGIYDKISRVNHSCASNNSQTRFDIESFSMELRAIRDIKAGEEVFLSYCGDVPGTIAQRQKFLAQYGFQCTCALCTNPASDHLYLKFLTSHEKLDESYEAWLRDLTLSDSHVIKPSLIWTSLMEQQGLPTRLIYHRHLEIITKAFIALGDLENSIKHGMKWAKFLVAMTGMEEVMQERSDPTYYLQDADFGTRRRRVGKAKGKGGRA